MTLEAGSLTTGDTFKISSVSPGYFTPSSVLTNCRVTTPTPVTITQCTITATDATVKISHAIGTPGTFVVLEIDNFVNPPTTTPIPSIQVVRNTIQEVGYDSLDNVQPATMLSASVIPYGIANNVIGLETSTVQFSFTTANDIPANGKVKLTIPIWNPSDFSPQKMITTASPTCANGVNLTPTSCSFNTGTSELTLTNVVSTSTAAGTTFTFTVSQFRNPYNAKAKTGFYIKTYTSTDDLIDLSSSISLTVTTPNVLSSLALTLSVSAIGAVSVYTFDFNLNLPIDASCKFKITGPTEVSMTTAFSSATGVNIFSAASSYAVGVSNQVVLTGCSMYYRQPQSFDSLSVTSVINPAAILTTGTFTLEIYAIHADSSESLIAKDTTTVKVLDTQLTAGVIIDMAVSATNPIVQELSSYTISLRPPNNLLSTSKLKIQFPVTDPIFVLTNTAACTLTPISGGIVASPTACTISANLISITNPFGASTFTGGTLISFTIASGYNPTSVKDAGMFYFEAYNTISGVDYLVAEGQSDLLFTPTKGTILSNLLVTSTSYETYSGPETYKIKFQPVHKIPLNGIIKVTVPLTSISIFSSAMIISSAQIIIDSGAAIPLTNVAVVGSVITMPEAFISSAFTPSVTGTTITLQFTGFRNPGNLFPSLSFQVDTYESPSYLIDQVTTGLTITMLTINELNTVVVQPVSLINGAITDYDITVNVNTPLINTDKFTLTFPSEITLPALASCLPSTALIAVTCVKAGNVITASLTFSGGTLASGNSFKFRLQNVQNPPDTRPTSVFTNIYTTDSLNQPISQYSLPVKVTTTTAATITSSSLFQAVKDGATATTYTMTITSINPMPVGGTFVVQYPAACSTSSITTCQIVVGGVTYTPTCSLNTGARKVTLANIPVSIPANTPVNIVVAPITNPNDGSNTDSMIVTSYTDSTTNYIIDQATSNMVPGLKCTDPCKTCLTSPTTSCTSCYNDGSTNLIYLYNSQCLTACPTGYYPDSSNICKKCDSTCKTCTTSTTCLTCSTSYPYMYNSKCYSLCPENTYKSGSQCLDCQTPCLTCNGGAGNGFCSSCDTSSTNPYQNLQGKTCQAQCNSGYVGINNLCSACKSPCLTCQINQYTCQSCVSGYFLYGTSCVSKCPKGFIANKVTKNCDGCDSNCKTCSGLDNICTECYTSFYILNNRCYSQCPKGFQPNLFNQSCEVIPTPPKNETNQTNNNTDNNNQTKNDTIPIPVVEVKREGFLIYIPHTLACGIGFCVALGSYFKDKTSIISSNSIAMWAPIEFIAILTQIFLAYKTEEPYLNSMMGTDKRFLSTITAVEGSSNYSYKYPLILLVTGFVLLIMIVLNIAFTVIICCAKSIRHDYQFQEWKKSHKKTSFSLSTISTLISFKINRLFYARFLGCQIFSAEFTNKHNFFKFISIFSLINIFVCLLPIILIDIWALSVYQWGSQFVIALIDTLIISIIMLVATVIDFKVGNSQFQDDGKQKFLYQDSEAQALNHDDYSMSLDKAKQRKLFWIKESQKIEERILKKNAAIQWDDEYDDLDRMVKGEFMETSSNLLLKLKGDTVLNDQAKRAFRKRRFSAEPLKQIKEKPEEHALSLCSTPRNNKNTYMDVFRQNNNVYAESKPASKKKRNVQGRDCNIQVQYDPKTGCFLDEDLLDHCQISPELSNKQTDLDGFDQYNDEVKRILDKNKLNQIIEEEQNQALSKLSKYETELQINPEQNNDGRISAMIRKFEEENPDLLNNEDTTETVNSKGGTKLTSYNSVERITARPPEYPPIAENRNFNENDILGDLDRDNNGNFILLENQKGQIVDKKGNLVNKKGYLIDGKEGNIINYEDRRIVFSKACLDEEGELPAPFSLEKYNFNPLEILGNLDYDEITGKPKGSIINNNGELMDKNGRLVNRSGYLIDKDGNLINRRARKLFDRRLLVKNDDLPQLLNYKGKRFDLREVIGDFKRDAETGDVLIKRAKDGKLRDRQKRLVNKRGYLIDDHGNIIDKKGNKIFERCALSKNGEFPKIFSFSKFNIDTIKGDYEVDPLGNPILFQDKDNRYVFRDMRGRRVNIKGYLVDDYGNIIDNQGNKVFDKKVLTQDRDIPKVFRKGMIRKDSVDSFSQIMNEIEDLEKRQDEEEDCEDDYNVSPTRFKGKQQTDEEYNRSGGHTPFESLMEESPTNYNFKNQRYENDEIRMSRIRAQHKKGEKEDEEEEPVDQIQIKQKPKKKKKKKVAKNNEIRITDRDIQIFKAYGETPLKGIIPALIDRKYQSKLSNIVDSSITGFNKDMDPNRDISQTVLKQSDDLPRISKDKMVKEEEEESMNPMENSEGNDNYIQLMNLRRPQAISKLESTQYSNNGRIRELESTYTSKKPLQIGGEKIVRSPKYRDCHKYLTNDPDLLADDTSVKEELESQIQEKLNNLTNNSSPKTQRYIDLKRIRLIKERMLQRSNSRGSDRSFKNGLENQDGGPNIFHGNRKQYDPKSERTILFGGRSP